MTKKQPEIGSPEHLEQMRKYAKEVANDLFDPEKFSDFPKNGVLSDNEELLEKSDAELFSDEIRKYTPEERRKEFKVQNKNNKTQKGSGNLIINLPLF